MKYTDDFNAEELLKVMLQVARNKRQLKDIEEKIDLTIGLVSDYRTQKIINILERNEWISIHPVFLNQPQNPSIKIFPFNSSEGEGLTHKGEDELNRLIEKYNKERKNQRKNNRRKVLVEIFKWIGGIISSLIITYFIWFFGWNGNHQVKHPDNTPNIQEQIKTDYDHIQTQITEIESELLNDTLDMDSPRYKELIRMDDSLQTVISTMYDYVDLKTFFENNLKEGMNKYQYQNLMLELEEYK